ncbi:hypothetical protein NLJ89_g2683 [Agrocybe chaxingu]|uniref:ABC transporter n=1 Tax=Agrocybe chaxingu TaxID=84603 RepID=A0A9W8K6U5_9AGAR|nr:hypothetical protein NLJ89_g2683 [Agrocybe chaxingu]
MPEPNPEQTASIFSLMTYIFMDDIIQKGYRAPRLSVDQLPPLADYDRASVLTRRAFPHMDVFMGAKRRHLFFSLMSVFRKEYSLLSLMVLIQSLCSFASPIGINQILRYLETDGSNAEIRPWFWISCLFFGPMLYTLAFQWYIFIATRTLVRTECILTELVFEHSLRIRVKAETSSSRTTKANPSGSATPVSAESSNSNEAPDGSSASNGKGKGKELSQLPDSEEKKSKAVNVIGKLNNLVTSDLTNITQSRDFLIVCMYVPLQITLSMIFLYQLLGWSAWVGFILTVVLIPAPGYFVTLMRKAQATRMKVTDARVQTVSEALNVLRMIKLFAWEEKVKERINMKREEELGWLWKVKLYDVVTNLLSYSIPAFTMVATYGTYTLIMKQELAPSTIFSSMAVFEIMRKVSLDRMSDFLRHTELLDAFSENDIVSDVPAVAPSKELVGFKDAMFTWSKEGEEDSSGSGPPYRLQVKGELIFKKRSINLIIGPTGSGKTSILMALLGEMHFVRMGVDSWFSLPRRGGVAYAAQESWVQNDTIRNNILFGSPYDEERYRKGTTSTFHMTHNIALAGPIADRVVSIGLDGSIQAQDTEVDATLLNEPALITEVGLDQATKNEELQIPTSKAANGKLVMAEDVAIGHVTWRSFRLFLESLGGKHPVLFFLTFVGGFVGTEFISTFQTWFLGFWGSQYEGRDPSEVNVPFYLMLYCFLMLFMLVTLALSNIFFVAGALRAAKVINTRLMDSIFGSTWRWLDETPTGRIITRCTQDVRIVDGTIPQMLSLAVECVLSMLVKLAAVVLFTPVFFSPGVAIATCGVYLGNLNAKAPVLSHFSASVDGLVSVRAYGAQEAFKRESLNRINHYTRVASISWNLNRWVATRIDALGAIFASALAAYLVYGPRGVGASNSGFSLGMAVEFVKSIFWWVVVASRMSKRVVEGSFSLERIQGYLDIDHEPKPSASGKPPAAWPTSGDLRVESLCARYSAAGPKVLHDISFHINSGQRIGDRKWEGRPSPSGLFDGADANDFQSSLTLALLRCILTDGTVYYDGIPTNEINLDALRSNITIIPQTPELLSGTLRENLDPFGSQDDATLNDALRAAGLFSLQEEAGAVHINLDTKIAGGGANLSIGQRQILALARAIVRQSKLLILDEATSAIDYKTDSIIQRTLRNELNKNATVITIAHRLQTIMDADRIMVLDEGRIVEFGPTKDLLQNDKGVLRALVDGSGDRDTLFSVVGQ